MSLIASNQCRERTSVQHYAPVLAGRIVCLERAGRRIWFAISTGSECAHSQLHCGSTAGAKCFKKSGFNTVSCSLGMN